jgi:pyridoxamine 5'-phosphate oxidase
MSVTFLLMDDATGKMISSMREEYRLEGLNTKDIPGNPFILFDRWLNAAIDKELKLPNAMHLATAGRSCRPSGRIVLLRGYDERGFVFFTSYNSRKGKELENNNYAALTFFWNELYRQVRIEGVISRTTSEESDAYFTSRPREYQISSIASHQSRLLVSRDILENSVREIEFSSRDKELSRPSDWGGYRLFPESFEFWQGRENRLHDRVFYSRQDKDSDWKIDLLYP